jgi:hypothetical protein
LENFYDSEDINRVWENIKENIKTLAKESLGPYVFKEHKSWFDEECSRFLEQKSRLKCSGYTMQTKVMYIIYKMQDVKPVDLKRERISKS